MPVNSATYDLAKDLGYQLALNHFSVKTGGYEGIMQGISEGAATANSKLDKSKAV